METKETVVIFEDVLTTCAHFSACKNAILEYNAAKKGIGVFIARRVPQNLSAFTFSMWDDES